MTIKLGARVETPGQIRGTVKARQEFAATDDGKPDAQVLVEWTDDNGEVASNWFEESTVTVR